MRNSKSVQIYRAGDISYFQRNGVMVGYTRPAYWSDDLSVGIVGVVPIKLEHLDLIKVLGFLREDLIYGPLHEAFRRAIGGEIRALGVITEISWRKIT